MSRRSTELETPFAPSPPGHRPEVGDIELEGLSLGGLETTIALPKWDVCFDIGRCPPFAVRRSTVLVTHAHLDHTGALNHKHTSAAVIRGSHAHGIHKVIGHFHKADGHVTRQFAAGLGRFGFSSTRTCQKCGESQECQDGFHEVGSERRATYAKSNLPIAPHL